MQFTRLALGGMAWHGWNEQDSSAFGIDIGLEGRFTHCYGGPPSVTRLNSHHIATRLGMAELGDDERARTRTFPWFQLLQLVPTTSSLRPKT